MRKILPILFFLALVGCRSSGGNPERVAERFLKAFYTHDYEKALGVADTVTRAHLEDELSRMRDSGITPAQWRAAAQPVIVEVEGIIADDGSRAVCAYKVLTSSDDANALIETLLLVKTDEGWRAAFY